jgi:hypothetical protein
MVLAVRRANVVHNVLFTCRIVLYTDIPTSSSTNESPYPSLETCMTDIGIEVDSKSAASKSKDAWAQGPIQGSEKVERKSTLASLI